MKDVSILDLLFESGVRFESPGFGSINRDKVDKLLQISEKHNVNAFQIHTAIYYLCELDYSYPEGFPDSEFYSTALHLVDSYPEAFYPISIEIIPQKIADCLKKHADPCTKESRRIAASKFTANPSNRKKVFDEHGRVCRFCGAIEKLTLDHIIPVSRGGEDCLGNMQVLCSSCNSRKGAKLESEL